MPPLLAALIYVAFIVWLLVRDVRTNPTVSGAVWIPWLWLSIKGSKTLTQWLYGNTNVAHLEGTAESVDRYLIIVLTAIALVVLTRRSMSWPVFMKKNWAITFYLLYALASIVWSDVPMTVFTQWCHMFLQCLMALMICTEQDPAKSFYAVFRRCAYVLLPLSVLYVKYYPELGRSYDMWTGVAQYSGVTDDRFALGRTCWVMGLMFLSLLFAGPRGKRLVTGVDRYLALFFLAMSVWLIKIADTSTALVALIIGSTVILGLQSSMMRRHLTAFLLLGCVIGGSLLTFTNIKDEIILDLGEDLTLTGRTELWADLQKTTVNPVVGAGFESFWSSERKESLWRKYWWHPNQAHNAYFEVYLNLGILGLIAMCWMYLSCYAKARRWMLRQGLNGERTRSEDDGIWQFKLAFLLVSLAASWTDASFRSVTFSFAVFAFIAVEYVPLPQAVIVRSSVGLMSTPRELNVLYRRTKSGRRVSAITPQS